MRTIDAFAHFAAVGMLAAVSFSVRCRYCRHMITSADRLGEREALAVRAHLVSCYPNVGVLPHTIGELLGHLHVSVAASRAATDEARERALVASHRAVLVITADAAARATFAARLTGSGYGVATADDAVGALRRLHVGFAPCAIVMDRHLPRVGGAPLASWLARHPRYTRIPVVGAGLLASTADCDALLAAVDRHCLA
jgi:CheY-like chemotaxis protein